MNAKELTYVLFILTSSGVVIYNGKEIARPVSIGTPKSDKVSTDMNIFDMFEKIGTVPIVDGVRTNIFDAMERVKSAVSSDDCASTVQTNIFKSTNMFRETKDISDENVTPSTMSLPSSAKFPYNSVSIAEVISSSTMSSPTITSEHDSSEYMKEIVKYYRSTANRVAWSMNNRPSIRTRNNKNKGVIVYNGKDIIRTMGIGPSNNGKQITSVDSVNKVQTHIFGTNIFDVIEGIGTVPSVDGAGTVQTNIFGSTNIFDYVENVGDDNVTPSTTTSTSSSEDPDDGDGFDEDAITSSTTTISSEDTDEGDGIDGDPPSSTTTAASSEDTDEGDGIDEDSPSSTTTAASSEDTDDDDDSVEDVTPSSTTTVSSEDTDNDDDSVEDVTPSSTTTVLSQNTNEGDGIDEDTTVISTPSSGDDANDSDDDNNESEEIGEKEEDNEASATNRVVGRTNEKPIGNFTRKNETKSNNNNNANVPQSPGKTAKRLNAFKSHGNVTKGQNIRSKKKQNISSESKAIKNVNVSGNSNERPKKLKNKNNNNNKKAKKRVKSVKKKSFNETEEFEESSNINISEDIVVFETVNNGKNKTSSKKKKSKSLSISSSSSSSSNNLDADNPIVKTLSGSLKGKKITVFGTPIYAFVGIRYARPPIGKLRFSMPQPNKWKGTRDAIRFTKMCPQQILPKDLVPLRYRELISEDCLSLNIWTPEIKPKKLRTVMVWIHGTPMNSANLPQTDGRVLSVFGDVIVVTINYRVGAFGFLDTGVPDAPGNMGIYDQSLALNWIKDNIGKFGGDPKKIVLFGQSSGAMSIGILMMNVKTKNIFKRAILESGSPLVPEILHSKTRDNSERFARLTKCSNKRYNFKTNATNVINCLKNSPLDTLLKAEEEIIKGSQLAFVPTFNGIHNDIPIPAYEIQRDSAFSNMNELLFGLVPDEGSWFVHALSPHLYRRYTFPEYRTLQETRDAFISFYHDRVGVPINVAQFVAQSSIIGPKSDIPMKNVRRLYKAVGDNIIACPTISMADEFAKRKKTVYAYIFNHRSNTTNLGKWHGVSHTEEIPFVFGYPLRKRNEYSNDDVELSKRIMHIWSYFAKSGKVPDQFNTVWPLYSDNEEFMILQPNKSSLIQSFHKQNCDIFKASLPLFDSRKSVRLVTQ